MLCGVSSKPRRGQLGRRRRGAFEFSICLGRALAMRTHEEMRDDRGWLVRQQLGTEPLHLDMAVRAGRCFEMLGGVSETINHGSLAFTEVIAEYPLSVCNKRHSARARPVDRRDYSRLSATLATVWSAPFFRISV